MIILFVTILKYKIKFVEIVFIIPVFFYIFVMIIIYSFFDIKIHLLRIKIHPHSYKNHY